MTLTTMLLRIGLVALVMTGITMFGFQKRKHPLMSLLQHFVGALFIFSGWVKAIDPLGTAYKMEQYFGEFASVFKGTWFDFISPVFPFFSEYAIAFSVFMIVFEIALGIMLVFGILPKLTSWLFLALVVFFTILTGFTFLTGYIPQGGTFFNFSSWAAYDPNNMKVTDCGCFGDFIKLEPRTSFFKDIFLLIPGFYFVWKFRDMHQLFNKSIRSLILVGSIIVLLFYSFSNYVWDLPHIDFRPFKEGVNVAVQKELEENAMASVQIVAWKLRSLDDPAKVMELPNDIFMKEYSSKYKGKWEVLEQIKTEPAVKKTKISDFELVDMDGNDFTYDFLEEEGYSLFLVCHKLKGNAVKKSKVVQDSIFTVDTVLIEGTEAFQIVRSLKEVQERTVDYYDYEWDEKFANSFKQVANPLVDKANLAGLKTFLIAGGADPSMIEDFSEECGPNVQYLTADDILLKTIVRSNPGFVLMKGGELIKKWHIDKIPDFDEIQLEFMK